MSPRRQIPWLQVFAFVSMCLIWGSTWMAIKVLVHQVPPLHAAAVRTTIAAGILIALAFARRLPWPATADHWEHIVVLGLTMMALPYGLLFWAGQFANSSAIALLYSALPLMVALLTPLMSQHKVPRRDVFSLAMAVGGIALLFQSSLSASTRMLIGGLAALTSVFCSAFSAVYAKRHVHALHPIVNTGLQMMFGAAWLFAASLTLERGKTSDWSTSAVLALLFLATFGSAVAFALYYWLLNQMKPYKLATSSLLTPIVAMVEGALFLGEAIPPGMLIAAGIVLAAVANVLLGNADVPELEEIKLSESGG